MVGEKTPKADIDEISSAFGKPGAVHLFPTTDIASATKFLAKQETA